MNCLIVDENDSARECLVQLVRTVDDLSVVAEYGSATQAYQFLRKKNVDLLLLNIELPDMSGIELTRKLMDKDPLIIFTTCRNEYAAEAFELNVVDYLLKPISPDRFIRAIEKARNLLKRIETRSLDNEFIFIRDSSILRRLWFDDILFAEATGDYVKLHTRQKVYYAHVTFKTAEERLPTARFLRVHRSFIVALDKIDSLQDGGIFIEDKFIPVADTYRRALNERIRVI